MSGPAHIVWDDGFLRYDPGEGHPMRPVRLAESRPIDLAIALPARNVESRTALLRDIYDPASPRFHPPSLWGCR